MQRQLRRKDYTVGWVCALPVELAAAQEMLDKEHDTPTYDAHDTNLYTCGRIGEHNVVIACLPEGQTGTNSAAAVAVQMKSTFPSTRFGLMVGIGGGVPSEEADVRLGDVVVSKPHKTHGGVVQYDSGKATASGFERTGALNTPPTVLLNAVANLRATQLRGKSSLLEYLSKLDSLPDFSRAAAGPDVLLAAEHKHAGKGATCVKCSIEHAVDREPRRHVVVHHGTIASGNKVIKDAVLRDKLSAELGGVLCFEMEAAGLMNSFPCLVIRGISDYADTHKNHKWQPYAAGTAAAYAKELLSAIPAAEVIKTRRVEEAMPSENKHRLQSLSPDQAPNKRIKTGMSSGLESSPVEQRIIPIYSQKSSQIPLNDEQRQCLLDSLRFEQIDARQMTIKTAHAKTCKWLVKCGHYFDWLDTTKLDEHHGFLWIKGKAGTGKSTLMKYAVVNARKTLKDYIVLAFFFNARGEDIEKSIIGTYHSLLLQLLERLPVLQSVFDSLSLSTLRFTADHQWNVETLKTLLEQAVRSLGDSSVVCFIDALDECEEEQVRDMIQFFEHIGDLAVSNGFRFQVCFSSRHYPYITIRHGLELVLEGQEGHSQDITNYIETELKIGKSKIAQRVRAELQEKASGIFMWVVLVVGILNKESDRGQVHTLQRKLREIPGDLHELFRDILTRDTHNKDGLVLCIQWVLFAKQPLSPEQLYHAILSGVDLEAVTEWDHEEITKDVIKRFILDSSKGLVEATVSKEQRVQFIHESVRDFLLRENGLGKIWPEFGSNFHGQSHERLKQCCLEYIRVDVATPLQVPDQLPQASPQSAADWRKSASETFPFLEYAVRNVMYHADTAEGGGIPQADFLDNFPLSQWVKLNNLFEKHKVRRHTERLSLLYLLAELDMANLIGVLGSASRCMIVEAERYGCPLFAAAATSSEKALALCMNSITVQRADSSPAAAADDQQYQHKSAQRAARRGYVYSKSKSFLLNAAEFGHEGILMLLLQLEKFKSGFKDSRDETVLWLAYKNGCERAVRSLLDVCPAMVDSKDKDNQSLLYVAAQQGNKALVAVLLEKGADVNAQGGRYNNALLAALENGHTEIATLLVDKGADVNAQGGRYDNPLLAALERGYTEIATLLLHKGADVNAQSEHYGNALQAASCKGHKEIVTLLLDKGADVNAQGGLYSNALQAASPSGCKDIVMLLLDKGADISAQGGLYGNVLQAAVVCGHKEIVTLLLDAGADVNAQGGSYGNALQAASCNGYKEIVTLLLAKGADINAQGGSYGNALQGALYYGQNEIVTLLLHNGADINAQGGSYGNALQAASYYSRKDIVTLLLDKGADINAQGGYYGSALQAASVGSYKEIVMLLLDKGADVNARGGYFGNALQAASTYGHKEIVTLLLDKGADINAQGGSYGNALQAASLSGHKEIVTLLLDRGANVDAQGGYYGNTLQAALDNGQNENVTLLQQYITSEVSE